MAFWNRKKELDPIATPDQLIKRLNRLSDRELADWCEASTIGLNVSMGKYFQHGALEALGMAQEQISIVSAIVKESQRRVSASSYPNNSNYSRYPY